jgi:hypothetical protein
MLEILINNITINGNLTFLVEGRRANGREVEVLGVGRLKGGNGEG